MSEKIDKTVLRKAMGKRLRGVRKSFGMSREELASQMKMSQSFLGLIERGERGINAERLKTLCDFFQCSADYLLLGKENAARDISPDSDFAQAISVLLQDNARQKLLEFVKMLHVQVRSQGDE
ncbi:MAG: helix-turn-helix domain-containing protein [Defluviitaleaceae bacterium]|nr:helix-turn-helix domain-containing protein [Defluviitaleaceae bacterium]